MLSRYMSTAIPDVRVEVEFMKTSKVVETGDDGYFEVIFDFKEPLKQTGWLPVKYTVLDEIVEEQEEMWIEGEAYIKRKNTDYAVISDVDDTILISHATRLFRKLRLILTKNSKTRLPFKGVASFYHALHSGHSGDAHNPIFYVSSSEWNLHDFLEDFNRVRGIPKGPFLLQDIKTSVWKIFKSGGGTHQHKLEKIRHLMELYRDTKFILIGDSGQRDAELYEQVVKEFPGVVLSIYIRDVSKSKKQRKVMRIADRIKSEGIEMLLIADTAEGARHAFENGFITREEMEAVERETREQERKSPALVDQVIGESRDQ